MKYSQLPINVVVLFTVWVRIVVSIVRFMYQHTFDSSLARAFIQYLGNAQFKRMTLWYVTSEFL